MFFGGDNLLAVHVAAAFRPCLVFEEDAGSAGLFKHLLCADDVQCIAVAGVAVGNNGKVGGVADAGQLFSHFRAGKEADIRLSQAGCGNGVAAHGEGFDACIGCDLGGQCVADARCNDDFSGFKHVSECDSFFCSCFHSKILLREKTKWLMDLDYQIICPEGTRFLLPVMPCLLIKNSRAEKILHGRRMCAVPLSLISHLLKRMPNKKAPVPSDKGAYARYHPAL